MPELPAPAGVWADTCHRKGSVALRSFVAVELDEACRERLRAVIERLKPVAGGVRWVRAESLHLTLKFVGQLPEADLPSAVECLDEAAGSVGPFVMTAAGVSGFPARGTPRVVHVGLHEPTGALMALQKAVEGALAEHLHIPREERPFTAHVTLGRTKDSRRCPKVEAIAAVVPEQDFGRVSVDSFVLMRSDLRPDGAVYTLVHRFPLRG